MARRASSRPLTHLSASQSNLQTEPYPGLSSIYRARIHTRTTDPNGDTSAQKEEVVIVGAGVAGLAAAAMLHKLGVKSRVLEQADSLRTGGVSLSLSLNAWNALDAIGVGDDLRRQYFQIEGIVFKTDKGRKISAATIPDDGGVELRAVERRALLQVLADQLPPSTIRYSSRLAKIVKAETGEALLQLTDGSKLSAKVVIGCDGIWSEMAKWMGFREPKYAGHCVFRGLREYPEDQSHRPILNYLYGKGIRGAYIPITPTKVYWFVAHNSASPRLTMDPSELKQRVNDLLKTWPPEFLEMVDQTLEDKIFCNPLYDRWLWPGVTPAPFRDRVVLAGDAWHPITPNMGQGACSALEDAVLLSRKLHGAIRSDQGSIEEAFRLYEKQRRSHMFKLGVMSNLVGKFLQSENTVVRRIRNELILPRLDNRRISIEIPKDQKL